MEEWAAAHHDAPGPDGFRPTTYGDSFADVYDDWYRDVSDVAGTVAVVRGLAGDGLVVELGVGTGRLAVPLADAGCRVLGLDVSRRMLDGLRDRGPAAAAVLRALADMADPPVRRGCAAVVLVAFNTLFNVTDTEGQRRTVAAAAGALAAGGRLVVEAFVPVPDGPRGDLSVRSVEIDRVVLVAARHDAATQTITGQHVELTEAGGVRLRPWRVRYLTPGQLDALAAEAGLVLEHRWADWSGATFTDGAAHHVSVYRQAP
jgi:predicted RNA methylase